MDGIAAQRNANGTISVVSPSDEIEFDINEDIMHIHGIFLGDFLSFEIENNQAVPPFHQTKGIDGIQVKVENNIAVISGLVGTLVNKRALFYDTTEFGRVACRDKEPGEVDQSYNILVSRLPEEHRRGLYSKCVWGGISNGIVQEETIDEEFLERACSIVLDGLITGNETETGEKESVEFITASEEENELDEESDVELEEEESEGKGPVEQPTKRVIGFVCKIWKAEVRVTCNLTFPGSDGFIKGPERTKLRVGDWVELRFTESEFNHFFPHKPTQKTPFFEVDTFKKIPAPSNYSIHNVNNSVTVTVKKVRLPANHRKGGIIEDRYVGTIADTQQKTRNGGAVVNIVVRRMRVCPGAGGKFAAWCISGLTESADGSSSQDDAESSSAESTTSGPTTSKRKKSTKKKFRGKMADVKKTPHFEPANPFQRPVLAPYPTMGPFPYHQMFPPAVAPAPPRFFFNSSHPSPSLHKQSSSKPVIHGQGYNSVHGHGFKAVETPKNLVVMRAVVTSVKKNAAFLWLLEKHSQSVFFLTPEIILEPGHFFEGQFSRDESKKSGEGPKWQCQKYLRAMRELIPGSITNGTLEFRITVNTVKHECSFMKPETYHEYIGPIIDLYQKLPQDCSKGIKITIKLSRIDEYGQWRWIVAKIFQSKHAQLLTEFFPVWHTPGIRALLNEKCDHQFVNLKGLLDMEPGDQVRSSQVKAGSAPANQVEKKEEETEQGKFAWVTSITENSVKVIVFPRVKKQTMRDMIKEITDKNVYKTVDQMNVHKLYKVEIDENGAVTEMSDCEQSFAADKEGRIEFKFSSSQKDYRITRNVALVNPIGAPAWIGKLMFAYPGKPIPKKEIVWKVPFHFLNDEDFLGNRDEVTENGVCFVNTDPPKKLNEKLFDLEESTRTQDADPFESFQKRLEVLPKEEAYKMFKNVCKILADEGVTKAMKDAGVDTGKLLTIIKAKPE
ncbi:unnamed protein product [Caenorhabditis sp. 36 PRJEB53466]|nr:unnamed protein product [Caenorhabditis sp. 36 PRJEB53466]